MPALGVDIAGVEDVDLFLSMAGPELSAAQAAMRTLLHAVGKLWWAPESGYDLNQHLKSFFDKERIQRNAQAAIELDERIDSAPVIATRLGNELTLTVNLTFVDGSTANQLTVTIDDLGKVLDASVTV
jgi:hypothetical protein